MKYLILLFTIFSQASFANKGLEVAKKLDSANSGFVGETSKMLMTLINARGDKVTRELTSKIMEMKKDGDKSLSIFHKPKDVAGTKMLTWTYKSKDDDQWLFLPSLKKVKRIRSNSKSASFMGSEFSYEDLGSQEIEKYTYKFISETPKQSVIERIPVNKSGYSKQIVTILKDKNVTAEVKYYNKRNELLKTAKFSDFKEYDVNGKKFFRANKIHMTNHLTKKQSVLDWSDRKLGVKLKDNEFKKEGLSEIF